MLISFQAFALGGRKEIFPFPYRAFVSPGVLADTIRRAEISSIAPSESIPIRIFDWLSALIYEAVSNPITVSDAKNG